MEQQRQRKESNPQRTTTHSTTKNPTDKKTLTKEEARNLDKVMARNKGRK
jgi:hypothetical protein